MSSPLDVDRYRQLIAACNSPLLLDMTLSDAHRQQLARWEAALRDWPAETVAEADLKLRLNDLQDLLESMEAARRDNASLLAPAFDTSSESEAAVSNPDLEAYHAALSVPARNSMTAVAKRIREILDTGGGHE